MAQAKQEKVCMQIIALPHLRGSLHEEFLSRQCCILVKSSIYPIYPSTPELSRVSKECNIVLNPLIRSRS